jgi:glycosyltransferase involved in cell wall biosynthesis
MQPVLRPRGISSRPLVSCIMPTFNRPHFVAQAIRLFMRQTWEHAELLIFDDSPKGARAEVPKHPRIKLFRLEEPTPMWAKHNLGLDAAQGEVLAHWDDDDWQSPLRLIREVEAIVLEGFDICGLTFDLFLTYGDGRFWRFDPKFGPRRGPIGNAQIRNRLPFMDATAMFRRSAIGSFRYPPLKVGQKVGFLQDVWDAGAKLKQIKNGGLYVYVRHDRNTWQYGSHRRLLPVPRPQYFPQLELPFYEGRAA